MTVKTFPKLLEDIAGCLRKAENEIQLKKTGDGRVASARSEANVVKKIKKLCTARSWKVETPKSRSWYDIAIIDGDQRYYIDIKISSCTATDNTNAKRAIYYFLTGETPEGFDLGDASFFKRMSERESVCKDRDYYYLIVNKRNTRDVFLCSLRSLTCVKPNPSNLPFQAKWDDNREPSWKNWDKARRMLLQQWAKSIQKRIESASNGMPEFYSEFFAE